MKLSGWGRYPWVEAEVQAPASRAALAQQVAESDSACIARGLGRSYGDSALAEHVLDTARLNRFLAFDTETGLLECESGASLAEILAVFVPKGWFLPVTPGTQYVTVGGAIASDVHGKNHHVDGCFSGHVESLTLATPAQGVVECSPQNHAELFRATCGGMGLTGVILSAKIRLKPIASSNIAETTHKAANLSEALELFEAHQAATYSVAWIDCLAKGEALGRSLVMLGEHAAEGVLEAGKKGRLAVPIDAPSFLLNHYTIRAFNALYYARIRQPKVERLVPYQPFFYPLDGIRDWNRLYGKNGFLQYQFVLPKDAAREGMTEILTRIAESGRGSFLAVLKVFGPANANFLSFPMEGLTLALDFKRDAGLEAFLDELDQMVLSYGGRVYLTKDARMSEATFKQSYPEWEAFAKVRTDYGADQVFHSLQSKRLGI